MTPKERHQARVAAWQPHPVEQELKEIMQPVIDDLVTAWKGVTLQTLLPEGRFSPISCS